MISNTPDLLTQRQPETLSQEKQAYVASFDVRASLARISPDIPEPAVLAYESEIAQILGDAFPGESITLLGEQDFYGKCELMLQQAIEESTELQATPVCFDRFIGTNVPEDSYVRLSFGRTMDVDTKTITLQERPGDPLIADQFAALMKRAEATNGRIVLVDDGVSTIETTEEYLEIFTNQGLEVVKVFAGLLPNGDGEWATESWMQENNMQYDCVQRVGSLKDWVCSRDWLLVGGKSARKKGDPNCYTLPYFYPFTKGEGASIEPDKLKAYSSQVLQSNLKLFSAVEQQMGRELTFQDIVNAGYGLPRSIIDAIPSPNTEMSVIAYLEQAYLTASKYTAGFKDIFKPEYFQTAEDTSMLDLSGIDPTRLVLFCGFSGGGRDTILNECLAQDPDARRARRITTRPEKASDNGSILYASRDEFMNLIAGDMLCFNQYPANNQLYGICAQEVRAAMQATEGNVYIEGTEDVIAMKKLFPQAKLIMILPPDVATLQARINGRDGGGDETLKRLNGSVEQLLFALEQLPALMAAGFVDGAVENEQGNIQGVAQKVLELSQ